MNDSSQPAAASQLGVVILGAGRSSRMGRPKLLLPWRESTVIGAILSQWRSLQPAQITMVSRPDDEAIAQELRRLDFPIQNLIVNPHADLGMFSSIQAAARWTGWFPGLTGCVIVLGDQPHLRTDTLHSILLCHLQHPDAICQPIHESRSGHPVLLPRWAVDRLKTTSLATLKDFMNQHSTTIKQCPVSDVGLTLDMDTFEDYKLLLTSHH